MSVKHRALVFPAGSEIGMEIFNSLKYSHHVELYGASGKNDHASFVYQPDHYAEDSGLYVDRPDFVERLNRIIDGWDIEFIFPTHDTVANFLAANQKNLHAYVVTSCAETNRIARFKSLTYKEFRGFDFCPKVYTSPYGDVCYPFFLKPDDGQGGKGTFKAESRRDLDYYLDKFPDLLVMEYLPGEEYSVDCFTDFSGKLRFVGPRTRERIQMGISFRSSSVKVTEEILGIAQAINDTVSLNGAWFFQIKRDPQNRFKLLEFAPRQSSTMGLYRHTGVNFALLSLFNAMKMPVDLLPGEYSVQLDRCLHNRFRADLSFSAVYIDYDETIVIGNHVHERVIAFLYQCRNRGIRIVLLTKHRGDIREALSRCCIAENLFDEIVHMTDEQNKCDFIDPEGAIFIDNYWYDRRTVKERLGIAVFDVDAIDCLLC